MFNIPMGFLEDAFCQMNVPRMEVTGGANFQPASWPPEVGFFLGGGGNFRKGRQYTFTIQSTYTISNVAINISVWLRFESTPYVRSRVFEGLLAFQTQVQYSICRFSLKSTYSAALYSVGTYGNALYIYLQPEFLSK